MEILNGRNMQGIDLGNVFNSKPSIKRLEDNLRFADTFNNRIMLADACLANGHKEEAIQLYESSLTGAFEENEYVRTQLITAYSKTGQFEKVVDTSRKICNSLLFPRSRAHMLYAMALEQVGDDASAEKEFKKMQSRFSFYEQRYQYGLFLIRKNRCSEVKQLFESMLDESSHLSSREKRAANPYLRLVREELKQHSLIPQH